MLLPTFFSSSTCAPDAFNIYLNVVYSRLEKLCINASPLLSFVPASPIYFSSFQKLIQSISAKEVALQRLNNGKLLLEQRLDEVIKQKEREQAVSTADLN